MIYFPQYYLCGEKQFTNLFQAFDHQKNTGHFPHYEIDPELIESLKHIKRPKNLSTQYIRDLIIKGLRQIRNKNSKLRLCLGGGTDSWTILDVCIKNDIYLDEVVTGLVSFEGDVRADLEYLPAIAYAKNHEPCPVQLAAQGISAAPATASSSQESPSQPRSQTQVALPLEPITLP